MNTKILEEIGLTKGEIKVYLALLELGSSTAGNILKKANIQNSVFHFNINRLIEKGLVSYIKKGKRKIYQAANPDNFLSYLKDKQKQVKSILPQLKAKASFAKEKEQAEIFEGIKGVTTALNILIEDAKKGDEFLFFSADVDEKNKNIQKFYKRYDAKRKDKKLTVKGITKKDLRQLFEKRKLNMKYTDFPMPENQGICNNKLAIISWGKSPKAVLITSKTIVKKQKEFFNALWNMI